MMTCLPTLPDQVSLVGCRARTWLLGLYELICTDVRIPMASILQTLVGGWICEKALAADKRKPDVKSLAREVQRRLDNLREQEAFLALQSSDIALVLLSAGILRALDSKSENIELFIQNVASSVQMHEDKDKKESAELFPTLFLLHNLHLHQDPGTYKIDSLRIFQEKDLFHADESVIRLLVDDITAATVYGQSSPSAEPELLERLSVALPIWMLYYLRKYNLEAGTLLLRAMNYLHLQEEPAFQMSINFVLAQQQPDGHFGFLAPEISQFRLTNPHFDEVSELYLPLTISCLWTIAEATVPDFILFSSI